MGLRLNWEAGLKHPLAIALLSVSVVLAAVATLDKGWSGQERWLLIWGLAGYASVSLYVAWREREAPPEALIDPTSALSDVADLSYEPNSQDLLRSTEAALRHLGSPAFLATSGLITQLPCTIAAARADAGKGEPSTPLDDAQLLRAVLKRSLEKLRQVDGEASLGEKESLQYHILHEHYVSGRPATYTMTRHSIAEATFHRYRREAVRAIAADLAAREQMLARTPLVSR